MEIETPTLHRAKKTAVFAAPSPAELAQEDVYPMPEKQMRKPSWHHQRTRFIGSGFKYSEPDAPFFPSIENNPLSWGSNGKSRRYTLAAPRATSLVDTTFYNQIQYLAHQSDEPIRARSRSETSRPTGANRRKNTMFELHPGYVSPSERSPRQMTRSHSARYVENVGWSIILRRQSTYAYDDDDYMEPLPSSSRPLTGARALRKKSPIVVNDFVSEDEDAEQEEAPHCGDDWMPEGGAIRRPRWDRALLETQRGDLDNTGDWGPEATQLDTSARRVSETVARESVRISKSRERSKSLYTAPDAFLVKKSSKAATVAGDPFSKDRSFDLPKGDGLMIRRSSKTTTSFLDVHREEGDTYKVPEAEKLKKPPVKSKTEFMSVKVPEKVESPPPKDDPPPLPPPAGKQVTCRRCSEPFPSEAHLTTHMRHAHPDPTVPCGQCGELFFTEHEMLHHAKVHEPSVKCGDCGEKFFTKDEMHEHAKIHKPQIKCEVEDCSECFFTEKQLKKHIKHKHPAKFKCPEEGCEEVFHSEKQVHSHVKTSHKKFPCKKCDQVLRSEQELHDHKQLHEPQLHCIHPTCNWAFFEDADRKDHFELYHRPQIQCSQCDRKFFTPEDLEHHFGPQHEPKLPCPKCDKWFVKPKDLDVHLPEHDPKIKCPDCKEMFHTKEAMLEHRLVHAPKFQCPDCPESFDSEAKLRTHHAIHEPQVACPKCTDRFFNQDQLEAHMPVHKPTVKCVKCDEMFFTLEEMEIHMKVHFPKKPADPPPMPLPELPPVDAPEPQQLTTDYKTPTPPPSEPEPEPEPTPELPRRKPPRVLKPRARKPRPMPAHADHPEPKHDPLDFLAKYCIVVKDRVPLYKRVFKETLEKQKEKYHIDFEDEEDDVIGRYRLQRRAKSIGGKEVTAQSLRDQKSEAEESEEEPVHLVEPQSQPAAETDPENPPKPDFDIHLISKSAHRKDELMDKRELLEKQNFILRSIGERQAELNSSILEMEKERVKLVCQFARNELKGELFPKPDAGKKKGKDKKKAGKKKKGPGPVDFPDWMDVEKVDDLKSDEYVMSKLNEDQWTMLASDRKTEALTLKINRCQQKLAELDEQTALVSEEKARITLDLKEAASHETFEAPPDRKFRRKQSALYQMLRTSPDPEIEISLVEDALRDVNDQLITERECEYIFYILDLPRRERVNFRMFSVIAALSERIKMLEPMVRRLINQLDFEALHLKMERAKELFYLLAEDENESREDIARGHIAASDLAVELAAGGIGHEHSQQVVKKLTRDHFGQISFLDFLTYIPLFVEIHQHITHQPLNFERFK